MKDSIKQLIPDLIFLHILFKKKLGYKLNLFRPRTFNEKIQWLKLHDRNAIYPQMVDKIEAKNYVSGLLGEEYVIPTLGVWDRFEDIGFETLPDRFVLKCSHDSGSVVVVRNKEEFDFNSARSFFCNALKNNFYWSGREWPYKTVVPRIIAEQYIEDSSSDEETLMDYKFYCFDGDPKFLYISQGLENHRTARISFVSLDWEFMPFYRLDYRPFDSLPSKPKCFDEMIRISKILSEGLRFVRVDLYGINERVYFSEFTFHPNSGFMPFNDVRYDYEIGKLLNLE